MRRSPKSKLIASYPMKKVRAFRLLSKNLLQPSKTIFLLLSKLLPKLELDLAFLEDEEQGQGGKRPSLTDPTLALLK